MELLREIDSWFARAMETHPEHISCQSGCSECCRSLFDITMLDAALLSEGFSRLDTATRTSVLQKVNERLEQLKGTWPEYDYPYTLNHRPEDEWQELMPEDDETPCVLLGNDDRCLVYEFRPMTCRLHGLPLIDTSGEIMHDEWCTENFVDLDPLEEKGLAAPFDRIFREEAALGREFTTYIFGTAYDEMDTFIPTALLIDFSTLGKHPFKTD